LASMDKLGGTMSDEELKAELERLRNENAALKKGASSGIRLKVSEKGAVSIYGMGWAHRRRRPLVPTHGDHLFRSMTTRGRGCVGAPLDASADLSVRGFRQV
jgi:hypothetical protein